MITELIAINKVLAALGVRPVTSAGSTHPDAIAARNTLDSISMTLQAGNSEFNRDTRTLVRDNNDEIKLPSNTISADAKDVSLNVAQRGQRLYNIDAGSFKFDSDVECELILMLDFDDLPFHAANFIMYTAAHDHYVDQDGDKQKADKLKERMDTAQILFEKTELRSKDVNALSSPQAQRLLVGMGGVNRNPNNIGG